MTDLITEAARQEEFFKPDELSEADNKHICAGLEALFAVETEPEYEFPYELSKLMRTLVGEERMIFVVNAGDGSTVKAFDPAWSFGVETDERLSRKRQGAYNAIVGPDLSKILALAKPLEIVFEDTIVVLREGGPSLEASLEFASLQDRSSNFLFLLDTTRSLASEIRERVDGLVCSIDLGEGAAQLFVACDPSAFGVREGEQLAVRAATPDVLDLLDGWVNEQRTANTRNRYHRDSRYRNRHSARDIVEAFRAIHREYGRRHINKAAKFDIGLVARRIVDFNPSEWAHKALDSMNRGDLKTMHKRDVVWFAQNAGLYDELVILEDKGILLIDPAFHERVHPIVEAAHQATTPLRPPRPQERLGHLHKVSELKCVKSDDDKGLVEGRYYRLRIVSESYNRMFDATEPNRKTGGLDTVRKKRLYWRQRIIIDARHSFYDDDAENIRYLLTHFAIPDPGSVKTRYPEAFERMRGFLQKVEDKYLAPRGFRFKKYQAEDVAVGGTKGRLVLAHEQGMGKTLEGMAFVEMMKEQEGRNLPALFIVPQDLIPQWQAEAKQFFGIELTWIGRHKGGGPFSNERKQRDEDGPSKGAVKNLIEAREVAKKLRLDPYQGGYYITHFEALTGGKNTLRVEEPYVVRIEKTQRWIKPGWRTNPETGQRYYFRGEYEDVEKEILSTVECPCGAEMEKRLTCPKCGTTRIIYKLPNIGSILATAFRKGVVVVDEGTQIASAKTSNERTASLKTKAVAGMRAKYRLVMSGTPIKNFVAQAFWLLWWAIGDKSDRFPYAYQGGKGSFAEDYSVFEWTYNDETNDWHKKKEVGEVTNPGRLWAQLGANVLRRTKDETGELIPQRKTHVIHTPLGYRQREQMQFWLQHFPTFYAEKHPDDPKSKRPEILESMAGPLGLDVKLNYAAVLPKTDRDWEWTGVPVSNYTPASLKTLETVMALVKQGRRVLIGTDIKAASGWIASELESKGVHVATMLDNAGNTIDPPKRAGVVKQFQEGEVQIISSTIKAIRLGHNLDKGSAVVLFGLTFDYEEFAQFRDRVHRLTSQLPVDVYVIVPGEKNLTLVGRKWDVITDKAKGAALALDGELPETPDEPVNVAAIVREMMEKGIQPTGNEILEAKVETTWLETPSIADFEIPEGFAASQAKPWVIDWEAANAALAEYVEEQERIAEEQAKAELAALEALGEFLDGAVHAEAVESVCVFLHRAAMHVVEEPEKEQQLVGGGLQIDTPTGPLFGGKDVEEEEAVSEETLDLIAPESAPAPVPVVLDPATLKQQLLDLKELFDLEVLTAEEFTEAKTALLGALKAAMQPSPSTAAAAQVQLALI